MALRFRELPWYFQLVLFVLVAVGVWALGWYVDFPPIFPIQAARAEQADLQRKYKQLVDEVAKLQAVKQRHQELKTRLAATKDQLAQIQTVVPEEKKTDEFMRTLQASATNAQVSLRRLTSRPVVTKEFYAEMPFEVELDGPYYAAMEFFDRLGRSTRIINAGGLRLQGIQAPRGGRPPRRAAGRREARGLPRAGSRVRRRVMTRRGWQSRTVVAAGVWLVATACLFGALTSPAQSTAPPAMKVIGGVKQQVGQQSAQKPAAAAPAAPETALPVAKRRDPFRSLLDRKSTR